MASAERLPPLTVATAGERWPLRRPFRISRGSKSEAAVLVVSVEGAAATGFVRGRGESVPDPRYGESIASCAAAIDRTAERFARGPALDEIATLLPPGAARSAIDCAVWDWRAKAAGRSVAELAGLPAPQPLVTAFTISLDDPGRMAAQAAAHAHLPLLKLKLGEPQSDAERLSAVREAAPEARLIIDANEGWTSACMEALCRHAAELGVELIEQPLPARNDAALSDLETFVPVCADESFSGDASLAEIAARYDAVNIKLEKAGGFTGALRALADARDFGLEILIGSFVGTSLSAAPALLLGYAADWVDLDGPLYLARDRDPGLEIKDGIIQPPGQGAWGRP